MKRTISGVIALAFLVAGIALVGSTLRGGLAKAFTAAPIQELKKEQPKDVVLDKDSQSDKYGEVDFSHENHATKNYSIDGKSVLGCAECHHTDQPADKLKAPLKTSERKVVLTTEALKAPDAPGVKTCRSCHLQVGDDSAELPVITYAGKTVPTKLSNEIAYHNNCNICHDAVLVGRPELKTKVFGSQDCAKCHKPIG